MLSLALSHRATWRGHKPPHSPPLLPLHNNGQDHENSHGHASMEMDLKKKSYENSRVKLNPPKTAPNGYGAYPEAGAVSVGAGTVLSGPDLYCTRAEP